MRKRKGPPTIDDWLWFVIVVIGATLAAKYGGFHL